MKAEATTVLHEGPLTLSSLDKALQFPLFRPQSHTPDDNSDPYCLGWEHVSQSRPLAFLFKDLKYVTAEGLTSFAAVMEAIRLSSTIPVSLQALSSIDRPQVEKIDNAIRSDASLSFEASDAFPLWKATLRNKRDCSYYASIMRRKLVSILPTPDDRVSTTTELGIYEALLNIFEHAYVSDLKPFWAAITISPIPDPLLLRSLTHVGANEIAWLNSLRDRAQMLEIAIADHGRNIPSTLWRNYLENHRHLHEQFKFVLGTRKGQKRRLLAHEAITAWAFHHSSTCKAVGDPRDQLARAMWRGLHKILNGVASLSGSVIIRSGQARIGHFFHDGHLKDSYSVSDQPKEFPGTSLILRIPVTKPTRRAHLSTAPKPPSHAQPFIHTPVIKREHLQLVWHPFRAFGTTQSQDIITLTGETERPFILHLFLSFKPECLVRYESFDEGDPGNIPRIVGFMTKQRTILWKFLGILPNVSRPMIDALENEGYAQVPSILHTYAAHLCNHYQPYLQLNRGYLHFTPFKYRLPEEDCDNALQAAFDEWRSTTATQWSYNDPQQSILLPSGRQTTEYVSVHQLLESNELLSFSLGAKFASILTKLRERHGRFVLVADSDASYFIANLLLSEQQTPIPLVGKITNQIASLPTVLFTDALCKGDTLKLLIERLPRCTDLVCCLDLRRDISPFDKRVATHSLLRHPIYSHNSDTTPASGAPPIEVDTVTHIPTYVSPAAPAPIGTDSTCNSFIAASRQIITYGLQLLGGRAHVAVLDVGVLVNQYNDHLIKWSIDRIQKHITNTEQSHCNVVFFTRHEAAIKSILPALCFSLARQIRSLKNIHIGILPVVPNKSRDTYARATSDFFSGITLVNENDFYNNKPQKYVAVYIDDACVTGRSLLHFLLRARLADPESSPESILFLPVVSKFSPAEEEFHSHLLSTVRVTNSGKNIPFHFCPLFRLPIRSFDRLESSQAYLMISRFMRFEKALPKPIATYIDALFNRISALNNEIDIRHGSMPLKLQHPLSLDDSLHEVSMRVIRIRQLIALQEQNIGVLTVLLKDMLDVFSTQDFSLLTVLALEPDLLDVPALRRECRTHIAALAVQCMKSDSAEAIKSDALAVLMLQNPIVAATIPDVLSVVDKHAALQVQFFLHLMTSPTLSVRDQLENEVTSNRGISNDFRARIRGYLHSFTEEYNYDCHNEESSIRAIRDLIAQTAYHGYASSTCKTVKDWLASGTSDRDGASGLSIRSAIKTATNALQGVVIPALNGMAFLLRDSHPGGALELETACKEFRYLVAELNEYVALLNDRPIGVARTKHIEELWQKITINSLRRPPHHFLIERHPSVDLPVIEKWLPRLFSSPIDLIDRMAKERRFAFSPICHTLHEQNLTLILLRVSVEVMYDIFASLLDDMVNHGTGDHNEIEYRIQDNKFAIRFRNLVREDDKPGNRRSQAKVEKLAHSVNITVYFRPPPAPRSPYECELQFPNYIICELYQHKL